MAVGYFNTLFSVLTYMISLFSGFLSIFWLCQKHFSVFSVFFSLCSLSLPFTFWSYQTLILTHYLSRFLCKPFLGDSFSPRIPTVTSDSKSVSCPDLFIRFHGRHSHLVVHSQKIVFYNPSCHLRNHPGIYNWSFFSTSKYDHLISREWASTILYLVWKDKRIVFLWVALMIIADNNSFIVFIYQAINMSWMVLIIWNVLSHLLFILFILFHSEDIWDVTSLSVNN